MLIYNITYKQRTVVFLICTIDSTCLHLYIDAIKWNPKSQVNKNVKSWNLSLHSPMNLQWIHRNINNDNYYIKVLK